VLKNLYLLLIFTCFHPQQIQSYQKTKTSISNENEYQKLVAKFYANLDDSLLVKAQTYASTYLSKAKKERDTIKIANGFYFLSLSNHGERSQQFNDSIIDVIQNKSTPNYPTYAYLNKAIYYFNKGKFKRSFDFFLKVHDEASRHKNTFVLYASKKNIGILKGILGENESALITLKECYQFYSKNRKNINSIEYLEVLFALSESYNFNKVLDSASLINKIGYKESLIEKNEKFKSYFILNEGINHFSKNNFITAKDSLQKSILTLKNINEKVNLAQAYFYLGKTLSKLGKQNEAIIAHKNADQVFKKALKIIPENRENYEILIQHYQSIGDKDNQLIYIQKLLDVDSILDSNYNYLIKNIVQNYDTPRLLAEKQEIINSLKANKKSFFTRILILSILSFVLTVFLIFNYLNRKKYKKRFLELYHANAKNKKSSLKGQTPIISEPIQIPENTIKEILSGLEQFEKNLGFLKPKLVSNDLAKKMNTNSKYLSKVINYYKKRSFSMYVNELRIDYCVEKLKTDKKFSNYTIKAIAREIGFNSVDAFSKSFFKIKGIQPSYFIRELEKIQVN